MVRLKFFKNKLGYVERSQSNGSTKNIFQENLSDIFEA